MRHQLRIDLFTQSQHIGPLFVAVGLGHAGRFVDARDAHLVVKLHLGFVHQAFNRCCCGRLWRAGQRNVAFAGQQARGRVQPDPACAGQIHLAPGVQVGEVDFGAARAVERFDVGGELDQIARYKAGGDVHVAEQLHQQPGRISARAAFQGQRFFGRLHTGFHADGVADVLVQALVDLHQKVDGALALAVHAGQVFFEQRRLGVFDQIRLQFFAHGVRILEGHFFGRGLQKKVKRVEHGHFGDHVHRDFEGGGLFGKNQSRLVVGKSVLLPVDEVLCRFDLEAVAQDAAAAVRRWAQADDLGAQLHRTVVGVVGDVVQGNVYRHISFSATGAARMTNAAWAFTNKQDTRQAFGWALLSIKGQDP